MLAIFDKELANAPKELNSPASMMPGSKKPKLPQEILSLHDPNHDGFQMNFGNAATLAYLPKDGDAHFSVHQRLFCGLDDIYCLFLGSLNNLCSLKKQYGLTSKGINEAMFVIEAYRTLRDRGPYPADQVVKDLEGSFSFIIYDNKSKTVFVSLSSDGGIKLYWGIAADGSIVICDNLEVIKGSCAKSFAPFPVGCMFHSEGGLKNYEHPINKMKAMPRVDSEGVMCGASFNVDSHAKIHSMPRVGSEANWSAAWESH
ncbi:hypothetical protein C5167_024763 [Papaver somniferum]|uniref:DUF3700 domain-containing protein n=1 Tax=Papaver somniferum TaxID=3469 RepID=A0A4Y7JSS4_PAPSO|nr:stem-specific protein TSJT1-like [Papaver somniferum]RZC62991.1 hypothetical protein C5167_024763 [Papaver somniferum]